MQRISKDEILLEIIKEMLTSGEISSEEAKKLARERGIEYGE